MNSVLLGNGINIQFGGSAYNSDFIMKRIKFASKLNHYNILFANKLTGNEIAEVFDNFVPIANDIRLKKYDKYANDNEILNEALKDFQQRYNSEIRAAHEIMIEDWFLILHVFFEKNSDIKSDMGTAIQGFEQLILDAIYNNGKIQDLHNIMKKNKRVCKFFSSFDNIFSLNYDNNIENLTKKPVYHLHGDFSVLADSENTKTVKGYIRNKKGEIVLIPEMKQCFCNALLNYSGHLKYKKAKDAHKLNIEAEKYPERYYTDINFKEFIDNMQKDDPQNYELFMTKILHPELSMATEYYFDKFENIKGELSIIGISPKNDDHIFNLILNNPNLTKVKYYYYSNMEKDYIKKAFPKFDCLSVEALWKDLKCKNKTYNCNYKFPTNTDSILAELNALSDDKVDYKLIKFPNLK